MNDTEALLLKVIAAVDANSISQQEVKQLRDTYNSLISSGVKHSIAIPQIGWALKGLEDRILGNVVPDNSSSREGPVKWRMI